MSLKKEMLCGLKPVILKSFEQGCVPQLIPSPLPKRAKREATLQRVESP